MNWATLLEGLWRWLEQRELLLPGARWVVGVSGGADSTLLLHALHELAQRDELQWKLHVAHLHHGLRGGDADADAHFVRELAERLGLPFHLERAEVGAEVAARGGSAEELGRQYRYEFFERVALRTGSDCVAVAHHADDDAETILHRICRGTGIRGLAGMRAVRPIAPGSRVRLVRPLLQVRRTTIEELCRERGLAFRVDRSNRSGEYTRGRIRNVVLPLLRQQLNPNVSEALLRLGEQARWLETYLRDAAARTFESLVVSDQPDHIVLNTRALLSKQRIIQAEVVRHAVALLPGGESDLSFANVEAVLRLAAEPTSGKEVHLPGALVVRKVYDRLEFQPAQRREMTAELAPVFVRCPGLTPLPQLDATLTVELHTVDPAKIEELRRAANPYEEWVDYDRLAPPLLVRGRRPGDRFWPLGAPGTKSLSDFFIDEKIEPALRARTGVLCDQAHIVWVIPLRIDERVKLRPDTRRALRLLLTPATRRSAGQP